MSQNNRSQISEVYKGDMKPVLSLSDVFAIGYGDLGSSIYYALGITALYALGATPLALMIAGLVFACTALTYAEMSSMNIASGGSANFTRLALNDLISFIAGWALLLDFIVTIAISAYSVAPYLSYFFPILKQTEAKLIFSIVLILILLLINIWGSKHSTRFSWFLTIITIVTQTIIVVLGIIYLSHPHAFFEHLKINGSDKLFSPTWSEFWKGTAMAMVAYTGIESMAQLTSETKNPRRTVPRAIMYAMGVLIVMYLAISFVALSALSPQSLSTTYLEDPIAGIVAHLPIGGAILGPWIGLLGAVILIVSANAGLVGASRLAFRMGSFYQLPKGFYTLHKRFSTPYKALLFFAILASLIVLASRGKLDFLADLYNFGAMLAFFFAHLALIVLRFKMPHQKRPFKVPFSITIRGKPIPIPSIIGCLATLGVWMMVLFTKPDGRNLGIAWLIIGISVYLLYRRKKKINPVKQLEIEKIKIPGFKKLEYSNIIIATEGNDDLDTLQLACEVAKHHKAHLTALFLFEVPLSISIHATISFKEQEGDFWLKKADAIGREFGIEIELQKVKTRSAIKALLEVVEEKKSDLLILSGSISSEAFNSIKNYLLKKSHCNVLMGIENKKLSSSKR